jgi:hypothetical protein
VIHNFHFILVFHFSFLLLSAGIRIEVTNHSEAHRVTSGSFDQDVSDFFLFCIDDICLGS